jgi:hypothetical protein
LREPSRRWGVFTNVRRSTMLKKESQKISEPFYGHQRLKEVE